ncbi:NAD(P)-dependent alcohol dehydrogenase [Cystobacter fuscus]|uniref:zinc-dependent alcohol dehydrogenase family protein n=1 Tax=Cystobacter fuscus TaxID=43 RepID=UPI002B28FC40|nr:NAD(P)-dependent alcohol dehydrogenase [Cystobacter fuscus]
MRRWTLKAGATTVEGLVLEDVPMPVPGPGEVRIRVRAVSLNYRDRLVLQGFPGMRLLERDLVPVSDGAGEVDAVGPGVETWRVGDRVTPYFFKNWHDAQPTEVDFGLGGHDTDGMLAECVVLPASRLARAPESLDFAETSTLPCAAVTAWNALHGGRPLGPDSQVLVLGSGGVSLFALLLARAAGARVFATSSQDDKLRRMISLGAREGVNYRDTPDWGRAIFERTGGVDKVIDVNGTSSLPQSLTAIRPGGEVALVGLMSLEDAPSIATQVLFKSATLRGIAVGSTKMYDELSRVIDQHRIRPPIARTFRFEDARDAYRAQASPELFGKIVIAL